MRHLNSVLCVLIAGVLLLGCKSKPKAPPMSINDEKRSAILGAKEDILFKLYQQRADAKPAVMQAPGYAVFSNQQPLATMPGGAEGYGVVFDNQTNLPSYMKMTQVVPAGSQVQLNQYQLVFIFPDRPTMLSFMQKGMDFSSDAANNSGIKIYQMTNQGVLTPTSVPMTRYWPYAELNQ